MATNPSGSATHRQEEVGLFGAYTAGVIAYCGFLAAALAAVMTNADFVRFASSDRLIATWAVGTALVGAFFALLSTIQVINRARSAQKSGREKAVRRHNWLAAAFGNIALAAAMLATVLTFLTMEAFARREPGTARREGGAPIVIRIDIGSPDARAQPCPALDRTACATCCCRERGGCGCECGD